MEAKLTGVVEAVSRDKDEHRSPRFRDLGNLGLVSEP